MRIFKVFVVLIAVLCFMAVGISNIQAVDYAEKMEAENKNLKAKLDECHEAAKTYNAFKKAAEEVGSETWNARFNNCYDHSKKLQAILAAQNIESSIMVGTDRTHAWICPWVEANTGNFIPPNQFKVLELRDRKLDVICKK